MIRLLLYRMDMGELLALCLVYGTAAGLFAGLVWP